MHLQTANANWVSLLLYLEFFKTIVEVLKLKYKRIKQVFKKGFNRQTAVRFMPHHARALLFWNSSVYTISFIYWKLKEPSSTINDVK